MHENLKGACTSQTLTCLGRRFGRFLLLILEHLVLAHLEASVNRARHHLYIPYVSRRQQTSGYVRIRQQTSGYVSISVEARVSGARQDRYGWPEIVVLVVGHFGNSLLGLFVERVVDRERAYIAPR